MLGAVLETLQPNVLCRVAGANDEQSLSGELLGVAEVMRVQDVAGERVEPIEAGQVWHGEVSGAVDDVVERLCGHDHVRAKALDGHDELVGARVEVDGADDVLEADKLAQALLLPTSYQKI